MRACAYMTEDAGDVRKQPFDEIWRTSPVFQELRTQAYKGAWGRAITRVFAADVAQLALRITMTGTFWGRTIIVHGA